MCYELKDIIFEEGNTSNKLVIKGSTSPDYAYTGSSSFYQLKSLVRIEFPERTKEIGNMAFVDCSALEEVIIPSSVERIGNTLFGAGSNKTYVTGCPNLKRVVIGDGDSDAPVQELEYFCIKDKGYYVTVWPKDYDQFDIVEFNIAGISHRDNIDDYLGEFKGTLEAKPNNAYDANAIKVLAADGHHVGYVPKDMTDEIRNNATLPCQCFCYIGENDGVYFSDCYILRPNVSPK
jgi:hypothetical protein